MSKAVDLACQAKQHHNGSSSGASSSTAQPVISLSLGPYGGMLSNGAEYTGDYRRTFLPESDQQREQQPSLEEMAAFHQDASRRLLRSRAGKEVGVLAGGDRASSGRGVGFQDGVGEHREEPPSARKPLEKKPVYISMAFPDDRRLPWPLLVAPPSTRRGMSTWTRTTTPKTTHQKRCSTRRDELARANRHRYHGTRPRLALARQRHRHQLHQALPAAEAYRAHVVLTCHAQSLDQRSGINLEQRRSAAGLQKPLLFLYPDGGLVYDAVRKIWLTPSNAGDLGGDNSATSWASNLMKLAKRITSGADVHLPDVWRGVCVGGCCKSGTDEIRAFASVVWPKLECNTLQIQLGVISRG